MFWWETNLSRTWHIHQVCSQNGSCPEHTDVLEVNLVLQLIKIIFTIKDH